ASKILEEGVSEGKKPVEELIRKGTNRLGVHIDKVLELSSLESGRKMMEFTDLEFRPKLLSICKDYKLLGSHGELDFDFELEEGPYPIRGEVFHLENVIDNLLENAKKYSDDPVVRIRAYKASG